MLQHEVKGIVIAGYYGFGNLGDELILKVIIDNFKKKYPTADLFVLSGHPEQTKKQTGVHSISRWNLLKVYPAVYRADLFVLGGGGLFQDHTSFRSLLYYLSLILLAQYAERLVFLYSVGVESIRRQASRFLLSWVLRRDGIKITVRDNHSKKRLEEMGVNNKNIVITGDPVFCLKTRKIEPVNTSYEKVLFVPRFPCPPEGNRLYRSVLDVLKNKLDRLENIEGLLFQEEQEKKYFGDLAPYLYWRSLPMDAEKIIERVVSMNVIVSARFHGLVLAAIAEKPFIGMGDYNKVGRFCESWNRPYLSWRASREEIQAAVAQVYSTASHHHELLQTVQKNAMRTPEHIA